MPAPGATKAGKKAAKPKPRKETARGSTGGLAPRKQLVKKVTQHVEQQQQLEKVAEGRVWWNSLSTWRRNSIYLSNAYGYEQHRNHPVDALIPLQPPPPRTGRLSRALTPGSRGPTQHNPIVCGWCDLSLKDMYDAFDHNLLERQTKT